VRQKLHKLQKPPSEPPDDPFCHFCSFCHNKGAAADPKRFSAKGIIVTNRDPKLTVAEVCDELNVAKSTFYDWRTKGRAPRCIRLPNGDLRIRRSELDRWIDAREDAA
jgi:excisionase family DNA binding protein